MRTKLVDRFFRYAAIDTQSAPAKKERPSTPSQMEFSRLLKQELEEIGLSNISLDNNGYLMAELPANTPKPLPSIGFIAHVDTSPDFSGKNVSPSIIKNYNGKSITLNQEKGIVLSPADFPELLNYTGEDLIVTNGTTLLGADDKAGIAEIVTAMEYLINHPEINHGRVAVAFTPDEEIGRGAMLFDVKRFACDWAYTIDGGEEGELEYENFNAAEASASFKGRNVHPGTAKNKMINALHLAMDFDHQLPEAERPSATEKYEGFFHLTAMSGTVEEASLHYIIRDHNAANFADRKTLLEKIAAEMNNRYPGCVALTITDQYRNMKEQIEPVMHIVELAKKAMLKSGVTPVIQPIRGGTDGATLSYMGLPCPNIFAGGLNFHGKFEFLPIPSMEKACRVIINIVKEVAMQSNA